MTNPKQKRFSGKTVKRLMDYIIVHNKGIFAVSVVCILISTLADVGGSVFIQILVDNYIAPLLEQANPVFTGLARVLCLMGALYLTGVLCTLAYSRLMVFVSQRSLKNIRDDMFNHMQSLPIRYFDTHPHGDIMSHYTNDTDTLRQFISQALPQVFASVITVIASFCIMLYYSWMLSLVVAAVTAVIVIVTFKISNGSTLYFIRQQTSLAGVNGYIEEMFNGQKVIKVFNHEQRSKEGFDEKNDERHHRGRRRLPDALQILLHALPADRSAGEHDLHGLRRRRTYLQPHRRTARNGRRLRHPRRRRDRRRRYRHRKRSPHGQMGLETSP